MRKSFYFLCREFLIAFFPGKLTVLQITSHKHGKEKNKCKKQMQKLMKNMLIIASKYEEDEKYFLDNPTSLFFSVYKNIDNLSEKELKLLQKFCVCLKNANNYRIINFNESSMNFYQYKDSIDEYILKKK